MARSKTRGGRATGPRAATGQKAVGQGRRGTQAKHTGAGGGGKARGVDRSCLEEQAAGRARQIQAAAAEAGLEIGSRLRTIQGDNMFERWRWGRVSIEGGGWLVTFRHDGVAGDEDAGLGRTGREVRHAVMHSQFGWGVYAVCEYKAEERLGWYDGEEITAERWERLGKHEGREHTIRTIRAIDAERVARRRPRETA